jgi:hypothetical protein
MALKNVHKRVVVSVDIEGKNWHQFEGGPKIRLERDWDNFNLRHTKPVNATVISAEDIPEGAEVLIHHNATHDTNRIFDIGELSGKEEGSDIKYFSLSIEECYAWKMPDGDWQPLPGFAFALRIFKPYKGVIQNIEPTQLKNVLWCLTGSYKRLAVHTLKAVDYEVIYQESNGREGNLIRCRPDGDDDSQRDPEFVAVNHSITKKVLNGELYLGLSIRDCKPLNKIQHA